MDELKFLKNNLNSPSQLKYINLNSTNDLDPKAFEFYKKKCEILEKDLFKSQLNNKNLEISLKKSQDLISKNVKVYHH